MKKLIPFILVLSLLVSANTYSQKVDKGLNQITPELLKKHIDYLASDLLKGRDTPSPELDIAADYIAKEFELLGIQKVNGSYFQNIPFCTKNLDVNKCLLKITNGAESKSFNLKTDYTPFEMTADASVNASIVFAGYGITAPEYNYDDYKDIDVKGKIVLIMKHEPGEKDPKSVFDGDKDTKHTALKNKLEYAKQHGAIGLMVVTDPLNHIMLTPQGYPWPSLSKYLPQDNLPVELCVKENQIPFVQVGDAVIKHLFGSIDSLKNIQKRIDETSTPQSFLVSNSICELTTMLKTTDYVAKNVVGFIEGRSSKLKKELIVIGGHYDHVGYKKKYKEGEDYIYNGADDNASGTAGVMAIAKAFSSMKKKPQRSVLFILFAGEEKGLYGSDFYVENPLLPLDKTVAMLNLDMISRNGSDSLHIDGFKYNPDLAEMIIKESEKLGMRNIPSKEDLFSRSDHYNFFKKGITALDISSGLHNDYHTVRDNPDSIDPSKAAQISKMTFKIAWIITNENKHYKIVKMSK